MELALIKTERRAFCNGQPPTTRSNGRPVSNVSLSMGGGMHGGGRIWHFGCAGLRGGGGLRKSAVSTKSGFFSVP
jgi:hypothetical protein